MADQPATKWCGRCRSDLPLSEFNRRRGAKDGLQGRCRTCNRETNAAWREAHRPAETEAEAERRRRDRRAKRAWVTALKTGRPCVDCGNVEPPECMDYDHLDGDEKREAVSHSLWMSWEDLLAEIQKCDLLCAVCHRKRTTARRTAG